jgi:hypothetical protein
MLNDARTKIQTEMDQNASDQYIQVIGDFILQHLEANPGDAAKIMQADKTIAKSFNELEKAARARKNNKSYAMIPPQEGLTIVLKYFGIQGEAIVTSPAPLAPVLEKKSVDFDVRLEDLL